MADTPVLKDHPLMQAWDAYKATPEYANSLYWVQQSEAARVGSLWAIFEAGWSAAIRAGGTPSKPERVPCTHRIADARNRYIKSGYVCLDCGMLFSAADHFDQPAAQPAQEPVAWQWLGSAQFRKKIPKNGDKTAWNPLYTTPPQSPWVGLTDEEVLEAMSMSMNSNVLNQKVYKAIEAKLKEKNT